MSSKNLGCTESTLPSGRNRGSKVLAGGADSHSYVFLSAPAVPGSVRTDGELESISHVNETGSLLLRHEQSSELTVCSSKESRGGPCSATLERFNEWAPVHMAKFQEIPTKHMEAQGQHSCGLDWKSPTSLGRVVSYAITLTLQEVPSHQGFLITYAYWALLVQRCWFLCLVKECNFKSLITLLVTLLSVNI